MKKIILLICILVSALALNAYSEPVKEVNLSFSPLISFGTYNIITLNADKEATIFSSSFLDTVNSNKEADSAPWADKMGTGVINSTTFWADVPRNISQVSEDDNLLAGLTWGFGKGLVSGIARGVSGAVDIATFSLPPYDKPLMEAEYKVENPNDGFKVDLLKW